MQFCPLQLQTHNFFIAPFYEDSTDYVEHFLIKKIRSARNRVYICSQHMSAYRYTYSRAFKYGVDSTQFIEKEGVLTPVIEKHNQGLDVRLLSQTYDDGDTPGFRKPSNVQCFRRFIQGLKQHGFTEYGVNTSVHGKFYIIDDEVITTSCNCTPTQFIYHRYVDLPEFYPDTQEPHTGIHCEVGLYQMYDSSETLQQYLDMFDLWMNLSETKYPLKK